MAKAYNWFTASEAPEYVDIIKATRFEFQHQTALHVALVGLAVLAYAMYSDDIVWALVRYHPDSRLLERVVFGVGAVVVCGSALLETSSRVRTQHYSQNSLYAARLLFALGLGLLLPLAGTAILIGGETILVVRLLAHDRKGTGGRDKSEGSWRGGFRASASKWGVAVSLILLAVTLQDRIAEIAAATGFLVWVVMNAGPSMAPSGQG